MICNKCKRDCREPVSTHEPPLVNTCGANFNYTGCYGSYALEDLVRYDWSLCEQCLTDLFETFALRPARTEVTVDGEGVDL